MSLSVLLFPTRLYDRRALIRLAGCVLISLALALFLAVPAAHAESPFNDTEKPAR
ncbi:MAG: hypothetical protein WCI67_24290 [Chloroflexales bacterium]